MTETRPAGIVLTLFHDLAKKALVLSLLAVVSSAGLRVVCLTTHDDEPIGLAGEPDTSRCERFCRPGSHGQAVNAPEPSSERCLLVADPTCASVLGTVSAVLPVHLPLVVPFEPLTFESAPRPAYEPPALRRFTPPPEA